MRYFPGRIWCWLTFQAGIHNEFQLPGGGVDPGESPVHALHREVFEETGWHVGPPRLVFRFRRFTFMPDYNMYAEKMCSVFVARPILHVSDPIEPDHSAVWLTHSEAARNLAVNGDRAALAVCLKL